LATRRGWTGSWPRVSLWCPYDCCRLPVDGRRHDQVDAESVQRVFCPRGARTRLSKVTRDGQLRGCLCCSVRRAFSLSRFRWRRPGGPPGRESRRPGRVTSKECAGAAGSVGQVSSWNGNRRLFHRKVGSSCRRSLRPFLDLREFRGFFCRQILSMGVQALRGWLGVRSACVGLGESSVRRWFGLLGGDGRFPRLLLCFLAVQSAGAFF
jgi:hypothetical protein